MRHRAHRVLAVLLLLVATVATVGPAGAAQPDEDDEPDVSVSLVSQSTYVGAGQDFTIRLRVEGARPDDQLKYVIWGAAERAELRAASENPDDIDEEALRDAGLIPIFPRTEPQPYQELVDESGVATLTIPQRTATVTPGVYPLTIHLKRDGDETGPLLTTTLVRVGELDPDAGPLEVALVLPLQADLAHRPDGSVSVHPDERRRLGALVELVERLPTLPVTLVPSPETIDALANGTAADAALLERITAIGAERRVLAGPYVPIDEEALRSAGLDLFIADLYGAGATTLATQLGTTPDPSIALLDPTDTDRTLSLRSQLGAHRLLVDDRALEPLDADDEIAAPLQSFVLHDSTGKPIRALATDSGLRDLTDRLDDDPDEPLLAAQRVVADLAAAYADDPETRRGTVLVLPEHLDPGAFDAYGLFSTLLSLPQLRFVELGAMFDTIPAASARVVGRGSERSGPLVRTLAPAPVEELAPYARRIEQTNRRLRALDGLVAGPTVPNRGAHLLELVSADQRLRADERRRYLDAADNLVTELLNPGGTAGLVGPGNQRVTMTSRRATIPIQIENRLGFDANVRIELRSEKLDFPDGWLRTVTLAPGPNTIEIEVESKVSGDSLLEVTVLVPEPDPSIGPLAQGTFTVRSTALSGVGVVLSALAVGVLLVWWARHLGRSRRAQRARSHLGDEVSTRGTHDVLGGGAGPDTAEDGNATEPIDELQPTQVTRTEP